MGVVKLSICEVENSHVAKLKPQIISNHNSRLPCAVVIVVRVVVVRVVFGVVVVVRLVEVVVARLGVVVRLVVVVVDVEGGG